MIQRSDKRRNNQLRRLSITTKSYITQADASLIIELGRTVVLCSITLQKGVPRFLRGQGVGWLNAEYAMLPAATTVRTQRESTQAARKGRSIEISRLIGRTLRAVTNLEIIGENTITVDCDVICADGGTRTASIIGASVALEYAQNKWLQSGFVTQAFIQERVAALSVGIMDGVALLDPNYHEDSALEADFNFILTESGNMLEVQGGAEKRPLSWNLFDEARALALEGSQKIFELVVKTNNVDMCDKKEQRAPLFSLKNRFIQK